MAVWLYTLLSMLALLLPYYTLHKHKLWFCTLTFRVSVSVRARAYVCVFICRELYMLRTSGIPPPIEFWCNCWLVVVSCRFLTGAQTNDRCVTRLRFFLLRNLFDSIWFFLTSLIHTQPFWSHLINVEIRNSMACMWVGFLAPSTETTRRN